MFLVMSDIDFASYADDNTPYVEADSIEDVIRELKKWFDSIKLFKYFSDNQINANKDECHVIVSIDEHVSIKLDDMETENSSCENY